MPVFVSGIWGAGFFFGCGCVLFTPVGWWKMLIGVFYICVILSNILEITLHEQYLSTNRVLYDPESYINNIHRWVLGPKDTLRTKHTHRDCIKHYCIPISDMTYIRFIASPAGVTRCFLGKFARWFTVTKFVSTRWWIFFTICGDHEPRKLEPNEARRGYASKRRGDKVRTIIVLCTIL